MVGAGELELKSVHTSKNRDEYMEYWGSSYRYSGGLKFNDDDTFIFTIGSWDDTFDRGGRYIIDMNNEQIYQKMKRYSLQRNNIYSKYEVSC